MLPNGLKARKVRSGSAVVIASGFHFGTTSRRFTLAKDEHLVMSAFLMHKTYPRRVSEKVVKRLSVYLQSCMGSLGHAGSFARAEMPHQELTLTLGAIT